ncbi:MAG: leucine-rich repeat domain-containing protein [Bacteroidaceae bacterium]|nr:leucine-rich repeat domain-containing protein [Bacteroidaceae bacterium]
MRRFFLSFLLMLLAAGAMAQATPDIRIKTNIYAKEGPTNTFTLVLGAAEGHTGYADIKCSGGNSSEANIITAEYDSESMALLGTNIACQVNEEGVVEVFCDDDVVIDYLSCTGAEITSVEFKNPENIEILALEHNALESLDLTPFTKLQALYLNDNPFNRAPLTITGSKPTLQILEMSLIENVDPNFDIAGFPNLVVFDAMSTPGLQRLTPSACPNLQKLSIDNTSVASLDVRNNPNLYILNISETRIPSIDLSKSTKLQQFYATHSSAFNKDVKLTEIDVTHCPNLIYLFLNDNNLTSLDLTKCPALRDIYVRNNYLTSLDLTQNRDLINVFISGNCMDFNSLPIPQETWGDFEYKQRPLTVPGAYLAGAALDLTGKIVRPDMETFAAVFTVSEDNPELSVPLDESEYTFSNGVLTIKEVLADSVYASFFNAIFPDIELTTTKFRVKDAATFGQPDLAATMGNALTAGSPVKIYVGMKGATAAQPKQFFVDLGDGQLQPFQATGERTPAEANVTASKAKFGTMKLYVPEGEELTAFKIADFKLISLDLSNSRSLAELTLTGTALTKLDLQWNRCLQSVDITGNNFGADFTLAGANGSYGKNILSHICLSNNGMTAVKLNEPGSWNYIDLSHNQLTEFNFTDADYVQYLDVSHNSFETLKINYLGQLKTFYCNDNQLREIVLPETNVIETFNCANNCFTLATLPLPSSAGWTTYTYAPQAQIEIPTKGPGYNLSDQYVEADGQATVFTWKKADGTALTPGSDYTCDKGVTHFGDNTIGQTL